MKNDGGPAFPINAGTPGMTLRDYFAAAALTGLLASSTPRKDSGRFVIETSKSAYAMADAMLAQREKGDQG